MKFVISAKPMMDVQNYEVPDWLESDDNLKLIEKSENNRRAVVDLPLAKLVYLKVKLGEAYNVQQLDDEE